MTLKGHGVTFWDYKKNAPKGQLDAKNTYIFAVCNQRMDYTKIYNDLLYIFGITSHVEVNLSM